MVQSRSTPSVSIQLTPMRIPEAMPMAGFSFATETIELEGLGLLVHPGEPSEMMVQIHNLERVPLQVRLQVEGNFPPEWCQIGGMEGNEIAPGEGIDAVLYFRLPATFFEDRQAILGHRGSTNATDTTDRLELNRRCSISIQISTDSDRQYIQYEEFNLYIRPHSTYMNFLPVLYREVDLIGRLMKIFELSFQPAIDSFNVMWANLDPLTAPRALLPFLAHWVAWENDLLWDVRQQRKLIKRAVELYRWRGTRKGLRLYLHLYTGLPLDEDLPNEADKHIGITEPFGNPFTIGEAVLGEAVLGGGRAFHFIIQLRFDSPMSLNEGLIRRIIEQEKPAFSSYELFIKHST
jgi:phage tail-like protein